jgi:anti-sigma-K factor RskA
MADEPRGVELDGPGDAELADTGLEAVAEALAAAPPAELRARVLAAVRREAGRERSARRWPALGLAGLAACALLALLYAMQLLDAQSELERSRDALVARLEQQQRELRLMEEAFAAQQEVVRILSSPHLVTVSLAATPGSSGSARVLLDPLTGKVAVIGSGLPPPQAGRVYAVWAIRDDGTPEPAGLLAPAGERAFAVRMREVAEPRSVSEFAISIEPDGGASRPTGPVVLTGSVGD